jgi:hypothetical protein
MALDNFIPVIWSARLLQNMWKALVWAQTGVINRDYEGDIAGVGSSVKIQNLGAVTVGTYTKNTDHAVAETLTDATRALTISQADFFNFLVDDIDIAQQKPKVMDGAMREAAYALSNVADAYIAALVTGRDAGNVIGTDGSPKTPDSDSAYEYLVDLGVILDEDNVPADGRWCIVPPWYHGLLLKDDRFVGVGSPANDAVIRNGVIGEAAGFTIMKSNNVSKSGNTFRVTAGHPMAWSFADQISKVEAYRPELRFADAVKGLHVYGAKVVRPTALAVLYAARGSSS